MPFSYGAGILVLWVSGHTNCLVSELVFTVQGRIQNMAWYIYCFLSPLELCASSLVLTVPHISSRQVCSVYSNHTV